MISIELQILIEACKVALLNAPNQDFKQLLASPQLDWQRLKKLVIYHGIRPILYTALSKQKEAAIPADFLGYLRNYLTKQSILNLKNTHELERLLLLFEEEKIAVLPYKGAILSKELYLNNQLREWVDIDLYVPKNKAKEALKLLIKDGYSFALKGESKDYDLVIDELLAIYGWHEVSLIKKIGTSVYHVDFHWELKETFYPYELDIETLFQNTRKIVLTKQEVIVPSLASIFLMTLTHHGGRESWMKLKHLTDILLFLKKEEGDSQALNSYILLAQRAKLQQTFYLGLYCLQQFLGFSSPIVLIQPTSFLKAKKHIIQSWEQAKEFWDSADVQLNHKRLLMKHQDEGFSKRAYWKEYLKFYSVPNVIEEQRLWTFKDKYVMLNLSSKVITYLWQKGFSK